MIDDDMVASFEELQVVPVAEREIESVEDRKHVHDVLDAMPGTLRVPLVMRDMDELSYDEIAAALRPGRLRVRHDGDSPVVKIDTDIVRIVTSLILGAGALAFGLSFGFGTRNIVRNIAAGFYARKILVIGRPA